jgi:hypothetical protein
MALRHGNDQEYITIKSTCCGDSEKESRIFRACGPYADKHCFVHGSISPGHHFWVKKRKNECTLNMHHGPRPPTCSAGGGMTKGLKVEKERQERIKSGIEATSSIT